MRRGRRLWCGVTVAMIVAGCGASRSTGSGAGAPHASPTLRCVQAERTCGDTAACKQACDGGNLEACVSVVDSANDLDVSSGDAERARQALVRACGSSPACGCYFLAAAPVSGTSDDDRLHLLERSCDGGSIEGCDALYEAELARCNADPPDLHACDVARSLPAAQATSSGSPPAWTGRLGHRWFSGCWRRALRRPDEPALFCFEKNRYFVWLPRGGWDAFNVSWTLDGLRGAWSGHVGTLRQLQLQPRGEPDTAWFQELDVQYGWGELSRSWGHPGTLERLSPARTQELEAVVQRLPSIESVCDAASRCAEAASRQLGEPGPIGTPGAPVQAPQLPSLMACREAAARSIASYAWHGIVTAARGAPGPAVPAACRAALPGR